MRMFSRLLRMRLPRLRMLSRLLRRMGLPPMAFPTARMLAARAAIARSLRILGGTHALAGPGDLLADQFFDRGNRA